MSYVPPHKRHSNDSGRSPVPDSLIPKFNENLNFGAKSTSHGRKTKHSIQTPKMVYAKGSISRWWPFGSRNDDQIPATFCLKPFSSQNTNHQPGEVALVLVSDNESAENKRVVTEMDNEPWVSITDRILPDLIATLNNVRDEVQSVAESLKPSLVARVGKILFHSTGSSLSVDAIRKAASAEADSRRRVHKSFHTNVPKEFVEYLTDQIVPKIGVGFESEKEHYHVKVFDKSLPDSIISCKCILAEDGKHLEIYKVELNQVRHLVVDISCLYKDLDLRVMLCNKRIMLDLDEEERDSINKLIKAAIIDPDVKGGLRWPLGKESVGDRFSIVGVWHTKYKDFRGPMVRIKLRNADRFDFKTSRGERSSEVGLKMTQISRFLQTGIVEEGPIREMLQGNIKLIWDHFLSYKHESI